MPSASLKFPNNRDVSNNSLNKKNTPYLMYPAEMHPFSHRYISYLTHASYKLAK